VVENILGLPMHQSLLSAKSHLVFLWFLLKISFPTATVLFLQ
jgi:hypothetical protein